MEEPEKFVSQTELDDKAQKLVEEKDADSRLRVYVCLLYTSDAADE